MKRALAATVLGLAVLAPGAAQAAETRITSVEAFRVEDRVVLHVVVAHPDRPASKLSPGARHDGRVDLVVRDGEGHELATRRARAQLPPAVPRAGAVFETYRFVLAGAATRDLEAIDVDVTARGRLDADGPRGDEPPATGAATFEQEVRVADVPDEPVVWTFIGLFAQTSPFCSLDDDTCSVTFGGSADPRLSDWYGDGGSIDINPGRDGRQQVTFAIRGQFLRGTTAAGFGSADLVIADGLLPTVGAGRITSGTRDVAPAGQVGGPMYLSISRTTFGGHDWKVTGYLKAGA